MARISSEAGGVFLLVFLSGIEWQSPGLGGNGRRHLAPQE